MLKITKIILLLVVCNGILLSVYADRGVGKRSKKISFDIKPSTIKSKLSFSLKSGLTYKGSLINTSATGISSGANTLVTYKKGNVTYIIPYKQKVIVPEFGKGYTGMKLIIKAN